MVGASVIVIGGPHKGGRGTVTTQRRRHRVGRHDFGSVLIRFSQSGRRGWVPCYWLEDAEQHDR